MNNTFSLKRFGFLLREILVERWVYFVGVFVIISVGQFLVGYMFDGPSLLIASQTLRFSLSALVGIVAVVAILVKRYQHSSTGVSNLLTPASKLEKWGSIVVIAFILFWVFFLLIFFIAETTLYEIALNRARKLGDQQSVDILKDFNLLKEVVSNFYPPFIFVSFFAAWIILSATYLRKNILPISIIGFGILLFVGFTINWFIAQSLFEGPISFGQATPFYNVVVEKKMSAAPGTSVFELNLFQDKSVVLYHFVFPLLFISALIIYYFRLKETEI